ncbi:MAG: phosphomannose isomerase type II C-terminal cupin domain [Candidatus Cloacimonetes bacterium]|nr:phosphomannose isomerase type II C-terminal cupin domain [Candidatus Cloacimonadota bacterium]
MEIDTRPWGDFRILADENDHKVKRITVLPGKRLSLQSHARRSEHWHVVSGRAVVTRDAEQIELAPGQSVDIPLGARHRVLNPDPEQNLVFIEIQRGSYFGEDDITRYEDDFGRV